MNMNESEKKKRVPIWVILIIIFFCLITGGIGVVLELKMSPTKQNTTMSDTVDQTILTASNFRIELPYRTGSETWRVDGEVKNNDKSLHYDGTFVIDVYGQNGELVASTSGVVTDMAPGETKPFFTFISDSVDRHNDIANYKDIKIKFDLLRPYY